MGRLTHSAFSNLSGPDAASDVFGGRSSMRAALSVSTRDPGTNHKRDVFKGVATYAAGDTVHVERQLVGMLIQKLGHLRNVPNHSTLVFAAEWSPCKSCTQHFIQDLLRDLGFFERTGAGLRVKFRFLAFYTQAAWIARGFQVKHADNFWESPDAARIAYMTEVVKTRTRDDSSNIAHVKDIRPKWGFEAGSNEELLAMSKARMDRLVIAHVRDRTRPINWP